MCCAEFIAKYVLFLANLVFALAGLAILGLGVAAFVQLKDIFELIPISVDLVPVSLMVLGSIVFMLAFLACCGAMKESRCMLITYAVFMTVLAAIKLYISIVLFEFLSDVQNIVEGWITSAFNNTSLRPVFNVMEVLFRCCGTTGPSAYQNQSLAIPPSCCATPVDNQCTGANSYAGCTDLVGDYFGTFGEAIAIVLLIVVAVELVSMIFAAFMSWSIKQNRRKLNF